MQLKLEARNICKDFIDHNDHVLPVLSDVFLNVAAQEFVSIVGASGCGKTTLLRILDGLIAPSSGNLHIDGREVVGPDHKRGGKLKIVLGASNDLIFSLMAPKTIIGYADLKGKRIGISTLAAADATLVRKMMAAHGLGPRDYDLIPAGSTPERAAALRAGSLSATVLTPPEDQRMIDEGYVRLDISTNVVKNYAWGGQSINEAWASKNHSMLVGYLRGWIRGARWLRNPANKDEAIAILMRETRMNDHFAHAMYDFYFGPNASPVLPDGAIDIAGYNALIEDMAAQGQLPTPPPKADKYIDSSYLAEGIASLKES
jgi:ABC-type nitrate/sulfonate/bicarbonate transport system substrate-binding protein